MLVAFAYLCIVVVAGLALVVHPGWAVCAYYFVAFMRPQEQTWTLHNARLSMPLVAITLAASALWMLRTGLPKVKNLPVRLMIVMVGHMALAGLILGSEWGPFFGHSRPLDAASFWRKFDLYYKAILVVFVASRVITSPVWLHRCCIAFGAAGLYLSVWANYRYFSTGQAPITGPGPHIGLYTGIFQDRNDFGMMLAMTLVVVWYLSQASNRYWAKAAWLSAMPMAIHAILLTESRGAILGAGAAMAYISFRSKRRVLMGALSILGLAGSLLFFSSDRLLARYGTIGSYEQDSSALSRINTWRVGWRMMWGNPLWGAGLDNYTEVFYDYSDWQPKWSWVEYEGWQIVRDFDYDVHRAYQAHNMFIQRGGESGLLGLLIFLWILLSVPIDTQRVRRWMMNLKVHRPGFEPTEVERMIHISHLIQGVMLPYAATGVFLSMEDFEALYMFAMLSGGMTHVARQMKKRADAQPVPTPAPSTALVPIETPVPAFPPPRPTVDLP